MSEQSALKRKQGEYLKELRQEGHGAEIRAKRVLGAGETARMELEGGDEGLAAQVERWGEEPVAPAQLQQYLAFILAEEVPRIAEGVVHLRNLLLQRSAETIQSVLDSPALPKLLALVGQERMPVLRLEACWVLTNLLSGSSAQTGALLRRGAVPLLFAAAASADAAIVEHAVWGLGNIASDCAEFRTQVLVADADGLLLRLYAQNLPGVNRVLVWLFSSFCRQRPRAEPVQQLQGYIRVLIDELVRAQPGDEELEADCVQGLQPCARNVVLELFLRVDLIARLVAVYRRAAASADQELLAALHQTFGALTSGPDEFNELLLRAGALPDLTRQLIDAHDRDRLKELCWVLSNVALGREGQIQALLVEPGLLDRLFSLAGEPDADLAKEALWVLCNLCKAPASAQTQLLLDKGLFALFLAVLAAEPSTKTVLVLDALGELLQAAAAREGAQNSLTRALLDNGVVEAVEKCQYAREDAVYEKAKALLERHFEVED